VQVILFLILHGALYHIFWATDSAKMYREEAFRFEYKWHFSNGGGLVSVIGAGLIAVTAIPYIRRHYYWVCEYVTFDLGLLVLQVILMRTS
jgi:hypothetical protein